MTPPCLRRGGQAGRSRQQWSLGSDTGRSGRCPRGDGGPDPGSGGARTADQPSLSGPRSRWQHRIRRPRTSARPNAASIRHARPVRPSRPAVMRAFPGIEPLAGPRAPVTSSTRPRTTAYGSSSGGCQQPRGEQPFDVLDGHVAHLSPAPGYRPSRTCPAIRHLPPFLTQGHTRAATTICAGQWASPLVAAHRSVPRHHPGRRRSAGANHPTGLCGAGCGTRAVRHQRGMSLLVAGGGAPSAPGKPGRDAHRLGCAGRRAGLETRDSPPPRRLSDLTRRCHRRGLGPTRQPTARASPAVGMGRRGIPCCG